MDAPRYFGRVVLTVIGAAGGLPGAFFGFLLGTLFDQTRRVSFVQRLVWRVARNPAAVRDPYWLLQCATALWGAAVIVAEGPPRPVAVEVLVGDPWWPPSTPLPATKATPVSRRLLSLQQRREAVAIVLRQRLRFDEQALAAHVSRRVPVVAAEQLVRRLVAVAAADPGGLSTVERAIIVRVSALLGVSPEVIRRAEREYPVLDRAACELLGVPPQAELPEVRRAYRLLATRFHPDTASELEAERIAQMGESFQRIHRAYETLLAQLTALEAEPPASN